MLALSGASLQQLRDTGARCWKDKKYSSSLEAYRAIVAATSDIVGKMLTLRASCHASNKELSKAASDLTTACIVDSGKSPDVLNGILKGRTAILEELGVHDSRSSVCTSCVPVQTPKERNEEDDSDQEDFDAEISSWCEETVNSVRRINPNIGVHLECRVPKFYTEYKPVLKTNQARTLRRLKRIHTECVVNSNRLESCKLLGKDYYPPTYFCKMRMKDDPEWWASSNVGDVTARKERPDYDTNCVMGHSNAYPQTMDLEYGQTHVAIGYVDLGVLLTGNFIGDPAKGPLHLVGYDPSAYSMAKTLVLLQMMKRGEAVEDIVQVAYSTGWSQRTAEVFEQTVLDLLNWVVAPDEVLTLLEHWVTAKETDLLEAQEHWLTWHGMVDLLAANIVDAKDRIELLQYYMTGRLLKCDVGSVVMHSIPEEYPQLIANETVFWTMSMKELGQHYEHCGTLMGVVVHVLKSRIERLAKRVQKREVTWDLRLKRVDPTSSETHKEIRRLHPRGISWSNLCDFVGNGGFHHMARACSADFGTQHYLHTIHWILDVKGTYLIDYPETEARHVLEMCDNSAAREVSKHGLDKHLLNPPVISPTILAGLASTKFFEDWCSVWLNAGGVKNSQVREKTMLPFSLVGRWEGTGYLSYTYN